MTYTIVDVNELGAGFYGAPQVHVQPHHLQHLAPGAGVELYIHAQTGTVQGAFNGPITGDPGAPGAEDEGQAVGLVAQQCRQLADASRELPTTPIELAASGQTQGAAAGVAVGGKMRNADRAGGFTFAISERAVDYLNLRHHHAHPGSHLGEELVLSGSLFPDLEVPVTPALFVLLQEHMGLQKTEAGDPQLPHEQRKKADPGLEPLDPGHVRADAPGCVAENHVFGYQGRCGKQSQLGGPAHHHFPARGLAGGVGEKVFNSFRVDP